MGSHATSADGTRIAYRRTGTGPGLLLVHGGGLDARQWDRVVPLLAPDLAVHTMDRRGRGASGPIRPDHSVAREAEDIAAVVRAIAGSVHLVGHSSGARYVMEAALLVDGLASLTLYEPSLQGRVTATALEHLAAAEGAGDREAILRIWQREVIGIPAQEFAALQRSRIWQQMVDNALTIGPELRALGTYDPRLERFAHLAFRVCLLLGGESDAEMIATVGEVHAAVPGSTIVTIPGQRHAAMLGAPERFAEIVRGIVRASASADGDPQGQGRAKEQVQPRGRTQRPVERGG